jgi:hypothetical protein
MPVVGPRSAPISINSASTVSRYDCIDDVLTPLVQAIDPIFARLLSVMFTTPDRQDEGTTSRQSPPTAKHTRRRLIRHAANWPAICSDRNGTVWDATVFDCSTGGLGLERCPALTVNQIVDIELDDIGTFACRVAWTRGGRFGVEFLPQRGELTNDDVQVLPDCLVPDRD